MLFVLFILFCALSFLIGKRCLQVPDGWAYGSPGVQLGSAAALATSICGAFVTALFIMGV
jgi:hypothetical protein